MLGTGRLLSFSFRALVLLLLVPLVWITVADRYNQALVTVAQRLLSADLSVEAIGTHIVIEYTGLRTPVSIEGYTLHYGLILLTVLILAAVGIGFLPRLGWLLGMGVAVFVLHVIGVALLAVGVAWASSDTPVDSSGTLVFSLFAVFWGLVPPLIGGVWALMYWLPRVARQPGSTSVTQSTSDSTAG